MGVTTSGLRWPEPSDPVAQGALAIRNLAEDVTARGARFFGGVAMNAVTLPAGGGTLGLSGTLAIPAVAYQRLIMVTLVETLASNTTWCGFSIRSSGANVLTYRASVAQHTVRGVFVEVVPANTARAFDATITSSAAAVTYNVAGMAELSAIAFIY